MKRVVVILVLVFVVFVVVCRHRLYLFDPLASVTRNGVKQTPVHVMINYSNDLLLNDQTGDRNRIYLVQHWDKTPVVPVRMFCLPMLACLTNADIALATPIHRPGAKPATMTDKLVVFTDEDGAEVAVALR